MLSFGPRTAWAAQAPEVVTIPFERSIDFKRGPILFLRTARFCIRAAGVRFVAVGGPLGTSGRFCWEG